MLIVILISLSLLLLAKATIDEPLKDEQQRQKDELLHLEHCLMKCFRLMFQVATMGTIIAVVLLLHTAARGR